MGILGMGMGAAPLAKLRVAGPALAVLVSVSRVAMVVVAASPPPALLLLLMTAREVAVGAPQMRGVAQARVAAARARAALLQRCWCLRLFWCCWGWCMRHGMLFMSSSRRWRLGWWQCKVLWADMFQC